jgi:hypothetical protein
MTNNVTTMDYCCYPELTLICLSAAPTKYIPWHITEGITKGVEVLKNIKDSTPSETLRDY